MEMEKQQEAKNMLKRLSDLPDDEILPMLYDWMILVGVSPAKIPAAGSREQIVLLDFMKNSLKEYQVKHFAEALEMAANNRLNCEPNPYDNFSPRYIGTVMQAYRQHLKETGQLVSNYDKERSWQQAAIGRKDTAGHQTLTDPQEIWDTGRYLYDLFKTPGIIWHRVFDAGVTLGIFKGNEFLSDEYQHRATVQLEANESKERVFSNDKERKNWCVGYAKSLVCADHFQNIQIAYRERETEVAFTN